MIALYVLCSPLCMHVHGCYVYVCMYVWYVSACGRWQVVEAGGPADIPARLVEIYLRALACKFLRGAIADLLPANIDPRVLSGKGNRLG